MSEESVTLATTTTKAGYDSRRHAGTRIKVARADHFRGLERVRKAETYRQWRLERSIKGKNTLAERIKKTREKTTRLISSAGTRWNREKRAVHGINCRRLQPITPALETSGDELTAQGSLQAESSSGSVAASPESTGATQDGPCLRNPGEMTKLPTGADADQAADHVGLQNPPPVVLVHCYQEEPSLEGSSPQPAGIQALPFAWGRVVDDETGEPLALRQPSWEFHTRRTCRGCVEEEGQRHQHNSVDEQNASDVERCHDVCVERKSPEVLEASAEASSSLGGTSTASSRGIGPRDVDHEEARHRAGEDSPCKGPSAVERLGDGRRPCRPIGVFEGEKLLSDTQEDPPQEFQSKGRVYPSDWAIPRRDPDSRYSPRTSCCSSSVEMCNGLEDEARRNVRREHLMSDDDLLCNGRPPWKPHLSGGPEPQRAGSSSVGGGMIEGTGLSGRGAGAALSSRDSIENVARSEVGRKMAEVQETRNRYLRQLEQRVREEAVEELRREVALKKVSPYPLRLERLGRRHRKEREAVRTYLERTGSDAELIIVQKMAKLGLIR